MDIITLVGLFVLAVAVYFGIPNIKTMYQGYLDFHSFFLVFGGTLAATLMSTSRRDIGQIFRVLKRWIFVPKKIDPDKAVKLLVSLSEKANKNGKQALTGEGSGVGDGFLARGLSLMGSGFDKDFVRKTLESDIVEARKRHLLVINKIRTMATYSPLFGMIGTILGIVQILQNIKDIDNILNGLALKLVATLYGLFLTTILFTPFANKLNSYSEHEILTKEILMEGILSMMNDEIPLKVEKYLTSFLEKKYQRIE